MLEIRQLQDHLDTIHARHHQIAEDQVEPVLLQAAQRLRAVAGTYQVLHAALAKQVEQVFALKRLIFDHQHPIGFPAHRSTLRILIKQF